MRHRDPGEEFREKREKKGRKNNKEAKKRRKEEILFLWGTAAGVEYQRHSQTGESNQMRRAMGGWLSIGCWHLNMM